MKNFLFLIILSLCLIPNKIILASSISMYSTEYINTTESFKVLITVDSEGVTFNSLDVIVGFDSKLVDFVGFQDSDTLFKNWIQKPTLLEEGKIQMAGIVPGGISGVYNPNKKDLENIKVVYLVFKAKKEGLARFVFNKNVILKNDGLGSLIDAKVNNLVVNIKNKTLENLDTPIDAFVVDDNIKDLNPPLGFVIFFVPASDISETKDMIIFNTNDLESGIKEYRIKNGQDWDIVTSPLVVSKDIFTKTIIVRAYDFSDNFIESSIRIEGFLPTYFILFIFSLVIVSGFFFRKLLK